MTQWRPIETAPKDGTTCIALLPNGIVHFAKYWTGEMIAEDAGEGLPPDLYKEVWYEADDNYSYLTVVAWMPLPEPPHDQ